MIRDTANTIRLAITLSYRSGKKGVGSITNTRLEPRVAVLGAPDQVDEDVGEGLRHRGLA